MLWIGGLTRGGGGYGTFLPLTGPAPAPKSPGTQNEEMCIVSQQPPQDREVAPDSDAAALRFYQQQLLRGFAEDYCADNEGAEIVGVRSDRAYVMTKHLSLLRLWLLGWTFFTPIYWFGPGSDLFKNKRYVEIRADDEGNPSVRMVDKPAIAGG